jgi:osmotically-inducible protein OsmY
MVRVSNGTVFLTGQVSSWIELKEADDLASEVRGVKSLEDNLVIKFKTERSDAVILKDVEDLLDRDVYLYNLPVNASVNNGKVILEGSVGSPYEKERAELDALSIMNVKSVENRLKIKPSEVYGVKQEDREPSDKQIKQYVETELNQDPRIDPFEIKVDVSEGVVTLTGSIPDFYERKIAEDDIRDVVGVLDVDNQLTVLTVQNVDRDEAIFIDVENRIESNDVLSNERIKVQVDDGVVVLTGRVSNYWEIHYATEVVSRVMGVRDIINNLTVNRLTNLKDDILEYKIKRSLESDWLTSLVSDNIKVTVKDGIATLQGKVDTYSEYREAARITSRTTGIWKVVNNLTIG